MLPDAGPRVQFVLSIAAVTLGIGTLLLVATDGARGMWWIIFTVLTAPGIAIGIAFKPWGEDAPPSLTRAELALPKILGVVALVLFAASAIVFMIWD